ncbi:MAG: FAD-dependent oxidoreductase, partial [Planctomycetota bacterium]
MAEQRVIANVNDLQDGQMKQVDLDEDRSILLVRVDGEFHALGSTCPHHGAPLADGILEGHRVVCPWHQSVFDAISGGYIEPPTFDGIPVYETRVEGENVVVDLPDKLASSTRPELATHDAGADQRTTVIVGSGAAGFLAAQSMREGDYRGRIVMITQEQVAPYDRTELSKRYLAKPDAPEPFLRPEKFYTRFGIDLQPGREVTEVDPEAKTVACADGTEYSYDRLLLATGSRPRQLPVEGAELENVRLLRTFADCEFLRAQAGQINRAVVVGASFIGMEVAGSLASRGVHVTVIAPESVPFELVMGRPVGRMYQQVHEENGNEFRMGRKVQRFEGDGKVEAVVLDDGERLEAEMVVIGIGVEPVTDYLKGIVANEKGAVSVDTR